MLRVLDPGLRIENTISKRVQTAKEQNEQCMKESAIGRILLKSESRAGPGCSLDRKPAAETNCSRARLNPYLLAISKVGAIDLSFTLYSLRCPDDFTDRLDTYQKNTLRASRRSQAMRAGPMAIYPVNASGASAS